MGGPAAGVILDRSPDESSRARLAQLVRDLGSNVQVDGDHTYFEVVTTLSIGGSYQGDGHPFGVEWKSEDEEPFEEEDSARREELIARWFGFLPASRISVAAWTTGAQSHRILGELVLHLAHSFGGIVNFYGALMPASTWTSDERQRLLQILEDANWSEVSESRERFFRTMPGRIVAIPYQTASGRTWVTHVCDCEFMTAWLHHPDFHMVK